MTDDRRIYIYCDAPMGHPARHPQPVAMVFMPPPEGESAWQMNATSKRMGDPYESFAVLAGDERFSSRRHQGVDVRNVVQIRCTSRMCSRTLTVKGERLDHILDGLDRIGHRRVSMTEVGALLDRTRAKGN